MLWRAFEPTASEGYGLLPELAFDAVLARARSGEAVICTPRLLEMMATHRLSVVEAVQVMDTVTDAGTEMSSDQRLAVQQTLECWWLQALQREAVEQSPGFPPAVVLGLVARWADPMTRWLRSWLAHLDGPGSQYLVDTIAVLELADADTTSNVPAAESMPTWQLVAPLVWQAWSGLDDKRGQLLAWARTETVVNGLVLIGATHLNSGHYHELFSDVLDVLLES